MKTIADLKEIVLKAQDKDELYIAEIDLQELIADLYSKIETTYNAATKVRYKGELSVANSLIGICRERQNEVAKKQQDARNSDNRHNYNFRMAAKSVLTKATYEKISQLAILTRGEVKGMNPELRNNKVSE